MQWGASDLNCSISSGCGSMSLRNIRFLEDESDGFGPAGLQFEMQAVRVFERKCFQDEVWGLYPAALAVMLCSSFQVFSRKTPFESVIVSCRGEGP